MTDNKFSITPPPELVQQWLEESPEDDELGISGHIATAAARWGADYELDACCGWLSTYGHTYEVDLRAARRPKPPSLKEQALQALALLKVDASTHGLGFDSSAIRRALESLPD